WPRAASVRGNGGPARHIRAAPLAARHRCGARPRSRSQGVSTPAIGVVGAGAWGTALAQMLAGDSREVVLWALEPELVAEINAGHTNSLFLPSAALSPAIRATGDLAEMARCEVLLLVTPAQHLAATLAGMPSYPRDLVLCAKGIEAGTRRTMHEVAADVAKYS